VASADFGVYTAAAAGSPVDRPWLGDVPDGGGEGVGAVSVGRVEARH
jgi:hypothetical protein